MPLPFDPDQAIGELRSADRQLSRLIDNVGPFSLTLSVDWSPFQALVHSVIFQQISKSAGRSIQSRVWDLFGGAPEPGDIVAAGSNMLQSAGLSRNKILAIRGLAQSSLAGILPDRDQLNQMDDAVIVELLTRHRGIGIWTAQMLLIFHLGRPDILPATDLGVRRGYRIAYEHDELPDAKALAAIGEQWRPWRSVASWYLWRANDL